MAEQRGAIGVVFDEPGLFGVLAGRYSGGAPNIEWFLKGTSGSPIRVDRKGRDPRWRRRPRPVGVVPASSPAGWSSWARSRRSGLRVPGPGGCVAVPASSVVGRHRGTTSMSGRRRRPLWPCGTEGRHGRLPGAATGLRTANPSVLAVDDVGRGRVPGVAGRAEAGPAPGPRPVCGHRGLVQRTGRHRRRASPVALTLLADPAANGDHLRRPSPTPSGWAAPTSATPSPRSA